MTCGIYKLTFSDGNFYIGKSVNIETRWHQHYDKMQKGTAPKLMQAAYDLYGLPKGIVLFQCHQDHLDIVEESLICRMRPPLNGTSPKDRLQCNDPNLRDIEINEFLEASTLEHIAEIVVLRRNNYELRGRVEELIQVGKSLRDFRTDREVQLDADNNVKALAQEAKFWQKRSNGFEAYIAIPWWKKLFQ